MCGGVVESGIDHLLTTGSMMLWIKYYVQPDTYQVENEYHV
jgi:hypothetical protein